MQKSVDGFSFLVIHPVLEKAKNFKSLKLLTREKTLIAHYKLHEWAPIYNVQIWTLIKFSRVGSG